MNEENKESMNKQKSTEIVIVDERTIRDKIYVVRGVQVMLDFELAEIYGYTTSRFNEQVTNNIDKFEGDDFCFYLTLDEFKELQNLISKKSTSSWGGRRKPPRAFTESGLYMLMTVLRGDLATKQSRALIRIFRAMKDYIMDTQGLASQRDFIRLSMQTSENTEAIKQVQFALNQQHQLLIEQDDKLVKAFEQISETVKKSELSPIMLDFSKEEVQREFLFLDGQPMKADAAYISIYSQAKKTIHIVDDYLGTKTLHLLQDVQANVDVTVFSDNKYNKLDLSDYQDFQAQFPGIPITFIKTEDKAHDRFIVLDYGTADERVFHCGPSSKDAGKKLAAITEFTEGAVRKSLHDVITKMFGNQPLMLR